MSARDDIEALLMTTKAPKATHCVDVWSLGSTGYFNGRVEFMRDGESVTRITLQPRKTKTLMYEALLAHLKLELELPR